MVELIGTEKQIEWATCIRDLIVKYATVDAPKEIEALEKEIADGAGSKEVSEFYITVENKAIEIANGILDTKNLATFYIDNNKKYNMVNRIKTVAKETVLRERKAQ